MRREIALLLLLATTTVGLKASEIYYQSISYRYLQSVSQTSAVQPPNPPASITVTPLPNGNKSYNFSIADSGFGTDSLNGIYYNAANAARAGELAKISLTLDAIHATQLLIQLLSISIVLRLRNSKPRMPPIFFLRKSS
jgi:hypothetical protein